MSRRLALVALAVAAAACARSPLPPAAPIAARPVLHESRSAHNRLIVTEEMANVRSLRFEPGGAYQSLVHVGDPLDLIMPYTRAVMISLALVESPRRVLVVGLGGGSMPMFLRALFPDAIIDAVELDPAVVEVAREFFAFREDARLRVHVADGREFVERAVGRYDLVFLDAYGPSEIPRHLATVEFLRAVRSRLAEGGVAVGNVWESVQNPLYGAMARSYATAFDQLCVLTIPHSLNRVFLARGAAQESIERELRARAAAVEARHRLPFELRPFLEQGCKGAAAGEGVLRDGD